MEPLKTVVRDVVVRTMERFPISFAITAEAVCNGPGISAVVRTSAVVDEDDEILNGAESVPETTVISVSVNDYSTVNAGYFCNITLLAYDEEKDLFFRTGK